MERTYTIGQAAEATGITAHTLRYYERIGLVPAIDREVAGRRRYSQVDLEFVGFLTLLRGTGMPIREMCEFVRLVRAGDGSVAERAAVLERHRTVLVRELDKLGVYLAALDAKIAHYRQREREFEAEERTSA
ncbi:MAG TPA: MerR family transcriptional regulator [Terriglobales bacterium]|nr:MerR family transcriptional regulator [Terriglobales bacterium]